MPDEPNKRGGPNKNALGDIVNWPRRHDVHYPLTTWPFPDHIAPVISAWITPKHQHLQWQPVQSAKLSASSAKPTSTSTPSRILGALTNLLPHRSPIKRARADESIPEPAEASGDMARASKSKSKSKSVEVMEVDQEEVEIVENGAAVEGEEEKDDAPAAEGDADEEEEDDGEYEVESILEHKQSGVSCYV